MTLKSIQGFLLGCTLLTSSAVNAASTSEVINGATCIPYPYPSSTQSSFAIPYQHWLYGFRETAYCHLTMSSDWTVKNLSYVLFTGSTSGGVLTARLCVHSGEFTVTCGSQRTSSGSIVNWVAPPSMPAYVSGAFIHFKFPTGEVSTIRELVPVWIK
jgi:hypothetical protein